MKDDAFQEQIKGSMDLYNTFSDTFSALLMGEFSTGKTSMALTGPKPVLLDAFDPRSHIIARDYVERGEALVRPFWGDNVDRPVKFDQWEKQWNADLQSGFINRFGTYCIDSLTTMIFSIEAKMRKGGKELGFTEFRRINNIIKNIVEFSQSSETVFVMTAHTKTIVNENTGSVECVLNAYPFLQTNIPLHFSEKYMMQASSRAGKREFSVLTGYKGKYKAGTQLGRNGVFDLEEVADFKQLLKKAKFECKDKPLLK